LAAALRAISGTRQAPPSDSWHDSAVSRYFACFADCCDFRDRAEGGLAPLSTISSPSRAGSTTRDLPAPRAED